MSTTEFTIPAPTNPVYTQSAQFPSGFDASALSRVQGSLLAISGLNSSGAIQAPSIVVVSVINVSGAQAATSMIAASNMQLSAGQADFKGSVIVQSGLNLSAALSGTIGEFLGSFIAHSGVNTSGAVKGLSGLFSSGTSAPIATASQVVTSVITFADATSMNTATTAASGTWTATQMFQSGFNASAAAQIAGALSVNGSVTVQSALGTSAALNIFGAAGERTWTLDITGSALRIWDNVGNKVLISNNAVLIRASLVLSAGASFLGDLQVQSAATFQGAVSITTSLIVTSNIVASTIGATSVNTSTIVTGSAAAQSGFNASTLSKFTTADFSSSVQFNTTGGNASFGGAVAVTTSLLVGSNINLSGANPFQASIQRYVGNGGGAASVGITSTAFSTATGKVMIQFGFYRAGNANAPAGVVGAKVNGNAYDSLITPSANSGDAYMGFYTVVASGLALSDHVATILDGGNGGGTTPIHTIGQVMIYDVR